MWRLLKNPRFLAGTAFLALLLVLAFWPKSTSVDLAPAERGKMRVTLDQEGETRVRDRFVVSAPVAGRVHRIELEPGDPVLAGRTVVAVLDPADPAPLDVRSRAEAEAGVKAAEAGLGRAEAERERAAAAEELARSDLRRMHTLAARQVISRQALESAKSQARTTEETLRAAQFSVANAGHELAMARARLLSASEGSPRGREPTVLHSPVDGVVLKRLRESEAVVPAGEPLIELGDPRNLEIVADFLSTDAVKIRPGDPVHVERWGGESVLGGRVRRVEPSGFLKISALGVEEQRVNVIIDFEDPFEAWKRLGDGYRVEVSVITWQEENVLKVPTSGLFRRGKNWAVFVAEDGRARLHPVQIGRRNDTEAQVLTGVSEGQLVVVHPGENLKDGSRVTPRQP
ncbi:MAG: efflux RND transporter periplasmic adaptor subunit [Thermodesulfobacteriota bacterium]